MKVTILGAAGKTGQELVRQALELGYDVVAYARDSSRIAIESPLLAKVSGELDDSEALRTAMKDSDCVLSALGPTGKQSDEELSDGIMNILTVMNQCGITRLIALSTTSAQDPLDRESRRTKLRRDMIRRGRPTAYEQIRRYSQLIRDSDCDWTLVRIAALLTDKPLSKKVCAGYLGKDTFRNTLSRADLAWFMLEQASSAEYSHKAPALSNSA